MSFDSTSIPDGMRQETSDFVPPSFERWLGRLQMTRLVASMGGFVFVWLVAFESGASWEGATVRAMVAGIALHFIAWAVALFVFGELYDIEVRRARAEMVERERERNRRIEEYYRERLLAKGMIDEAGNVTSAQGQHIGGVANVTPLRPGAPMSPSAPPSYGAQAA